MIYLLDWILASVYWQFSNTFVVYTECILIYSTKVCFSERDRHDKRQDIFYLERNLGRWGGVRSQFTFTAQMRNRFRARVRLSFARWSWRGLPPPAASSPALGVCWAHVTKGGTGVKGKAPRWVAAAASPVAFGVGHHHEGQGRGCFGTGLSWHWPSIPLSCHAVGWDFSQVVNFQLLFHRKKNRIQSL